MYKAKSLKKVKSYLTKIFEEGVHTFSTAR